MQSADAVYDQLNAILRDLLDDDALVLAPDTTAKDVDGWDSMTNVQLMLSVEKTFGLHLSAARIAAFRNVGDLVAYIVENA